MPLPINSKFIGITALGARIARAVDFAARTDVWAELSKPTAWTGTDPLSTPPNQPISDLVPPIPNPTTVALDTPVVAVKASLLLVVPDNVNGTIEAYGMLWRVITPQNAASEGCRWVLVNASFDYNIAPTRQVDSYLTANVSIGDTVLPLFNAGGYQVGDQVIIGGINGQQTTVDVVTVNSATKSTNNTHTTIVSLGAGTVTSGPYALTVSTGTTGGTYKFRFGTGTVVDNVTWVNNGSVSATDTLGGTLTVTMNATPPSSLPVTDTVTVTSGVNTITVHDPLLAAEYAGYWVTDITYPTAFSYRQVGILSHVTFPSQAQMGQNTVPAVWVTDGYLEWYYNDQPVPRRLNGRDGVLVILTF